MELGNLEGDTSFAGKIYSYSLLVRYLFILGSQNVYFSGCLAKITTQPKSKQITFNIGDFMYHLTAWLSPKESNINEYLTSRQYLTALGQAKQFIDACGTKNTL
jgi:hypothetical protein